SGRGSDGREAEGVQFRRRDVLADKSAGGEADGRDEDFERRAAIRGGAEAERRDAGVRDVAEREEPRPDRGHAGDEGARDGEGGPPSPQWEPYTGGNVFCVECLSQPSGSRYVIFDPRTREEVQA